MYVSAPLHYWTESPASSTTSHQPRPSNSAIHPRTRGQRNAAPEAHRTTNHDQGPCITVLITPPPHRFVFCQGPCITVLNTQITPPLRYVFCQRSAQCCSEHPNGRLQTRGQRNAALQNTLWTFSTPFLYFISTNYMDVFHAIIFLT